MNVGEKGPELGLSGQVRVKFGYTKVSENAQYKMKVLRKAYADLADEIISQGGKSCRELSLAIESLEESSMWINKAICINDVKGETFIP